MSCPPVIESSTITSGINASGGLVGQAYAENVKATATASNTALVGAITAQTASELSWRTAAQTFLAGLGAYKQYKLYDQQGDLAAAQMRMVDQQKDLLLDQYNNITKPLFDQAKDKYYGYYWSWGKSLIEKIAECGSKVCEYTPDQNILNRAMAQVSTGMNQIKLRANRGKGMYQSGKCCAITIQLAAIEGQLRVDAYNMAARYEDTKKLQWDQFYWNKNLGTAQIAQNVGSQTANLMVQQGSQLQSVAAGITQLINTSQNTLGAQFGALSNQAKVFGSLGSIAGEMAGSQYGQGYGAAIANIPNMYSRMGGMSVQPSVPSTPRVYIEAMPSQGASSQQTYSEAPAADVSAWQPIAGE